MPPKRIVREDALPEVSALGIANLVLLAQVRNSPLLITNIMSLKREELVAHAVGLREGGEFLSACERDLVNSQMKGVEAIAKRSLASIKMAFKTNNIPTCSATTKDKLALVLALAGDPAPCAIALDVGQRKAVEEAFSRRQTIIVAGPGAGKTTTLCGFAMEAANAGLRVAILAYNRGAERVMKERFKCFEGKVKMISREKAADGQTSGVLIMTFDKYIYAFRTKRALARRDDAREFGEFENARASSSRCPVAGTFSGGYEKAFRKGLDLGAKDNENWDVLVIDEAQDVKPVHRELIDQLLPRVRKHAVVAGDPRQELYSGANWFSAIVSCPGKWEISYLRNNHRSVPGMVAALNHASRILFPTLHHDQTLPGGGSLSDYEVENGFGGCVRWVVGGHHAADEVARCFVQNKSSSVIGLTPVTIEKWNNNKIVASVMQSVYKSGSDRMVLQLGRGTVLADYAYFIGTARTAKGTERDHVVIFAPDIDYTSSGIVSHTSFVKLLFVCLSRARKSLTIILNGAGAEQSFVLREMIPKTVARVQSLIKPRPIQMFTNVNMTDLAKLPFWRSGKTGENLSTAIDKIEAIESNTPAIRIDVDARYAKDDAENETEVVPDSDIIGIAVEASIATNLGFDVSNIVNVRPAEKDPITNMPTEILGIREYAHGASSGKSFQVVYDDRKLAKTKNANEIFQKRIMKFVSDNADQNPAYTYVILQRSAEIGDIWALSERLRSPVLAESCAPWARYVCEVFGDGALISYQKGGSFQIRAHRSRLDSATLSYKTDFQARAGDGSARVVEVKHTNDLTIESVAQACGYATVIGAESAELVNTKKGERVVVSSIPQNQLSDCVRAWAVLKSARAVKNLRERAGLARNIPQLVPHIGREIIFIDTESGRPPAHIAALIGSDKTLITEIGAVCVDISEQEILLDTFHTIGRGVIEMDNPPTRLSNYNVCAEMIAGGEEESGAGGEEESGAGGEEESGAGEDNDEEEGDAGEEEEEDEGDAPSERIGTGAGTAEDPWIPFAPASLAVPQPGMLARDQKRMIDAFARWASKLLRKPEHGQRTLVVQWAGRDAELLRLDPEKFEILDAHRVYRWYLERTGQRRIGGTSLDHAVHQLFGPGMVYAPHRAFEDALLTAAVIVAIQAEGGAI